MFETVLQDDVTCAVGLGKPETRIQDRFVKVLFRTATVQNLSTELIELGKLNFSNLESIN